MTQTSKQPASSGEDPVLIISPVTDVELAAISKADSKKSDQDPFLVTFNPEYDEENPRDWRSGRKWAVTDVISATGFNRIMVSTIMAPALSTIAQEFDMNSAESVMALSIYLLATAFGPLIIGPLSEIYGRSVILHASNVWFLVWNIACGFANSKGVLIAARFMAGFGASSVYALSVGVLGDVWSAEQRGRSLGYYLLIPLLGAAVGKSRPSIRVLSTAFVLTLYLRRSYYRWFYGCPYYLEVDVLVYINLPSCHDCRGISDLP